MVERSRRGNRKKKRQVSHQRCWLWGRHLVRETLAAERWPIDALYLADDLTAAALDEVRSSAERHGVAVRVVDRMRLESLAHTSEHQGFLAKMGPFPYAAAEDVLAAPADRPLYLVLDAIQ